MNRILFILLLTIPFVGFGQDWERFKGTSWTLNYENGDNEILHLKDDLTFTLIFCKTGEVWENDNQKWYLEPTLYNKDQINLFCTKNGKPLVGFNLFRGQNRFWGHKHWRSGESDFGLEFFWCEKIIFPRFKKHPHYSNSKLNIERSNLNKISDY